VHLPMAHSISFDWQYLRNGNTCRITSLSLAERLKFGLSCGVAVLGMIPPIFKINRICFLITNGHCMGRLYLVKGHCNARRRKWRLTDSDLCPCGETQTMFHIVESCLLTKLNGGLSRLHSADEDAVSWLTSYGS